MKRSLMLSAMLLLLAACSTQVPREGAGAKTTTVPAAAAEAPKAGRDLDSLAINIAAAACKRLAAAPILKFRADIEMDAPLASGQLMQVARRAEVQFRRPDGLRIDEINDRGPQRLFYDGKRLYMWSVDDRVFVSAPGQGSVENMMKWLQAQYGFSSPLRDLLVADPCANLMKMVTVASYGGLHVENGHSFHHLLFRAEPLDFQVWVRSDPERPEIHKLLIEYRKLPGIPRYVARFDRWQFKGAIAPSTFQFKRPPDVAELEFKAPESRYGLGAISAQ